MKLAIKFDWSNFLDVDQAFAIDPVIFADVFTHSKYVGLKTKDAMADQYRNKYRRRPSIDTDKLDVLFNVHSANDFLQFLWIALGSS
ncbi:MAG: hypothetical protein ABJG47_19340 [Ekhidna sp.]